MGPNNRVRPTGILIAVILVVANFGCGGSSSSSTPLSPITVSVSPTSATVQPASTQAFTATVANDAANLGVTWAVFCSVVPCGTVSPTSTPSGATTTYTAPSTPRANNLAVTLTATSVGDGTKSASAGITIGTVNWPMYGRDLHHSFALLDSVINAQNVGSMVQAWVFTPGDAVSASPTVVDGVVYVGSWDGFFYALDAASSAVKWKFQVDCDTAVVPVPPQCLAPGQPPPDRTTTDGGLITSSATVSSGVVYFTGGKTVYALNSPDGQLIWKRTLCGNPDAPNCELDSNDPTRIFSSPMIFEGMILLGQTVDGVPGYRGAIMALHLGDGSTAWRFEVDPILSPSGQVIGVNNRGCGSVWSTGAVDEINRLVAFGTGDCQTNATPPYHEAVLALDIDSGALRWVFRPQMIDGCDFDFGASPNVFDIDGQRYVGIGNKNGTYYVLHSDSGSSTGQLLWSTNVVFGGISGGFIGSTAFDGQRIYGGTGLGDFGAALCDPSNPRDLPIQEPSFHTLNLGTGAIEWEDKSSYTFGASTVGNGVVFNGTVGLDPSLPPSLQAFDVVTGQRVGQFPMTGSVNSSATIVGNMIFLGTGNSFDGGGSSVQAFVLQ